MFQLCGCSLHIVLLGPASRQHIVPCSLFTCNDKSFSPLQCVPVCCPESTHTSVRLESTYSVPTVYCAVSAASAAPTSCAVAAVPTASIAPSALASSSATRRASRTSRAALTEPCPQRPQRVTRPPRQHTVSHRRCRANCARNARRDR